MLPAGLVGPVVTGLNRSTRWTGGVLKEDCPEYPLVSCDGLPLLMEAHQPASHCLHRSRMHLDLVEAAILMKSRRTAHPWSFTDPSVHHSSGHLLNSPCSCPCPCWHDGGSPSAELLMAVLLPASLHRTSSHQPEPELPFWLRLCELTSRCRSHWSASTAAADCAPATACLSSSNNASENTSFARVTAPGAAPEPSLSNNSTVVPTRLRADSSLAMRSSSTWFASGAFPMRRSSRAPPSAASASTSSSSGD